MARTIAKPTKEEDDGRAVLHEKLDEVASRLELVSRRVAHAEERLEGLSKQVATLELRMHEEVE